MKKTFIGITVISIICILACSAFARSFSGSIMSLDSPDMWTLVTDPDNVGKNDGWFEKSKWQTFVDSGKAATTKVPWVIQDIYPDYHGYVWYYRTFVPSRNDDPEGRYLLKFWNVDYKGDVWLNGKFAGEHEGAEGVFVLDVTDIVKPGKSNFLAVRVLNPTDEPIDGIALGQTPHRNKTSQFVFGNDYNHGGIEGSVEFIIAPAVRVSDIFVMTDIKTGVATVQATITNTLAKPVQISTDFVISPASEGGVVASDSVLQTVDSGESVITREIKVRNFKLWDTVTPNLYRASVSVLRKDSSAFDEYSVKFGFREFKVENGFFHLNGKRIFLRSSHTGNENPIGFHYSSWHEWARLDLINVKTMGFNAIRFIAGLPTPYQLDLCDEIGLLVYEEPYAAWKLEESEHMQRRFNKSVCDMIKRDRNHPSVVVYALLNETHDGNLFRHVVSCLPMVRELDNTRLVVLSGGRFDHQLNIGTVSNPGSSEWEYHLGAEGPNAGVATGPDYPSKPGVGHFHIYPQVPHRADAINAFRTVGEGTNPVYIGEYGVATGVDFYRLQRNFEMYGKENTSIAKYYGSRIPDFDRDWAFYDMASIFGRPEDFFMASLSRNANQRLMGLNAIRSNPNINGYNLTGTTDQGLSGEGLVTLFREMKPGTVDAMIDGFAPLRWCTFAEPVTVFKGNPIKFEAVVANEDVIAPGTQLPARIEVFNEKNVRMFEARINVTFPEGEDGKLAPLAFSAFNEDVIADWPTGKYRFVATFEEGAAAAGGTSEFYVFDWLDMPSIEGMEVVLWGDDPALAEWLRGRGVTVKDFAPNQTKREIILVGEKPAEGGQAAFAELARHIARGSKAIFLCHQVFAADGDTTKYLPLKKKGKVEWIDSCVYHKDEWIRDHFLTQGLQHGLMDYTFYRETIQANCYTGIEQPKNTVSGAMFVVPNYKSGIMLSTHDFGAGEFVLNTLLVRESLFMSPVSEYLIKNMMHYAKIGIDQPLAELNENLISEVGLK